eukprot:COSAG06_NODE_3010_length_5963_cov_6.094645_3_plen_115_part_00
MAILVGGSVVHGDHNDAARGRQGHVDVRPPPLLLPPLPPPSVVRRARRRDRAPVESARRSAICTVARTQSGDRSSAYSRSVGYAIAQQLAARAAVESSRPAPWLRSAGQNPVNF